MDVATVTTEMLHNPAAAYVDDDGPAVHLRPRFRGVSIEWGFFVSLVLGGLLIASATHARGAVAVTIYALSLSALLATSALYHRIPWTCATRRRWLGRLDHAMIFVLIAGSYTPYTILGLLGPHSTMLLVISWSLAVLGSILTLFWYDQPKWVIAVLYVGVSWIAVFSLKPLLAAVGPFALTLLLGGGVLYSVGAVIYARKWPDPVPLTFGYHEVFHAFVLGGAAAHFIVAAFLLPI